MFRRASFLLLLLAGACFVVPACTCGVGGDNSSSSNSPPVGGNRKLPHMRQRGSFPGSEGGLRPLVTPDASADPSATPPPQ
ncbi:MAG: hypothetical protein HY898_18315 [Deltaproteobacteria bacterium]|nr:hypothetical protein [Deltaproteobacteria bacterium]